MTRLTISLLFREKVRYWARLLKSRRSSDDDAMIARDYDQLYWDEIRGMNGPYAGPRGGQDEAE